MLKRKPSQDFYHVPYVRNASIYAGDPTHLVAKRKRLFRTKDNNKDSWTPAIEHSMSDLLEFILQHEEAFKNQYRVESLYADFRQQLHINPEGYHANIAAWTKALTDAARAGVIPTQGSGHNILCVQATDELVRALQHTRYGRPVCLPAVFHESVQSKEMMPLKDFSSSKESIYSSSWLPSPWKVLQWSLRQVGVLGQPQASDTLQPGSFVIIRNLELAAAEIIKEMKECTSTADRVLSKTHFLQRFSNVINPAAALTTDDLDILLIFLARDKRAISYDKQTIKFKAAQESAPLPVTEDDAAIAKLRDTLANIQAQIPPLVEKMSAADAAAREAVAAKQMIRAKAALRSKKLAETALAQRSDVAHQLESVYQDLQQAADQVEIVEAMCAGAAALKGLNEKVGGVEGVQGVVDAVSEQMATTEEISSMINESNPQLDEAEIDDEFEILEKAEKEKQEHAETARTAARLAELHELDRQYKEQRELELKRQADGGKSQEAVGMASQQLAKLSFYEDGDEKTLDAEGEKRVQSTA